MSAGTDPLLAEVELSEVRPAPKGNSLWITVTAACGDEDLDRIAVQNELRNAYGCLRTVVAAGLNRKRVPELVFWVEEYREVSS